MRGSVCKGFLDATVDCYADSGWVDLSKFPDDVALMAEQRNSIQSIENGARILGAKSPSGDRFGGMRQDVHQLTGNFGFEDITQQRVGFQREGFDVCGKRV